MNILKKPVPACLSAFALAGITKPTILASVLKVIGNIPTYIEAYEEAKKSFSDNPQKDDGVDEKVLTKQETGFEQKQ